jgi:hypothetical protein
MTTLPHTSSPHAPESPWEQWYKRYHGSALHRSGANPDFVGQLIAGLLYPPWLRRCQRIVQYLTPEEIDQLVQNATALRAKIEVLERLWDEPASTQLPASYLVHTCLLLLKYYRQFNAIIARFREAQQRAEADDPLLTLLRREKPDRRRKGRPSYPLSTLFMVLLSEHVQVRCGKPRYAWVGRVAAAIFPQCFDRDVLKNSQRLAICVLDRCRKFRKIHAHDLPRLREAVLSITENDLP